MQCLLLAVTPMGSHVDHDKALAIRAKLLVEYAICGTGRRSGWAAVGPDPVSTVT